MDELVNTDICLPIIYDIEYQFIETEEGNCIFRMKLINICYEKYR